MSQITQCPKCKTRFRDGRKSCPGCQVRNRYIRACPRCGRRVSSNNYNRHKLSCQRLPPPAELAHMFDTEPYLSASKVADIYRVNWRTVIKHMDNTAWDAERLIARGRAISSTNRADPEQTTPCARCGAMYDIGKLDPDDPICDWCHEEISEKLDKLRAKPSTKLCAWDLDYLQRKITA